MGGTLEGDPLEGAAKAFGEPSCGTMKPILPMMKNYSESTYILGSKKSKAKCSGVCLNNNILKDRPRPPFGWLQQ